MLLEPPVRLWACPSCETRDRTQKAEPHTQMHYCSGLRGLAAPLVEVRTPTSRPDADHKVLMREDYCKSPYVPPVMSVRTDHGDGSNDCTAFASVAVMRLAAPPAAGGVGPVARGASASSGAGFHHRLARHRFFDPELEKAYLIARILDATMAWAESSWCAYYVYLMGTNGVKPSADSFKFALFGNSVVPAQSTTAALNEYAGASSTWSTGNETSNTSGTAYSAGGLSITVSWGQAGGSYNYLTATSATSIQWTSASFTAYGGLAYDTTVSNTAMSWNYFGGQQVVTNGTFTVTLGTANGITNALAQIVTGTD